MSGVVEALTASSGPAVDRDYTFDLRLDPGQAWTPSLGSYVLNGGTMHVEVVPWDQPSVLRGLTLTPGNHRAVLLIRNMQGRVSTTVTPRRYLERPDRFGNVPDLEDTLVSDTIEVTVVSNEHGSFPEAGRRVHNVGRI